MGYRFVRKMLLPLLLAMLGCASASAADFATTMLESTFKLFHQYSTGTSFLVNREGPDTSLYLVTAAHVLSGTKGDNAILVLRKQREDGTYERHDHPITIRRDDKPLWVKHETEDVAVLKIREDLPVSVTVLPIAAIADEAAFKSAGLHICSPLFVLTYPQRFEANPVGFAVARQGIIASQPLLPFQSNPTYFGDFTTFAGDSGGPVFVEGSDGKPLLIGIVLAQNHHFEVVKSEYEERKINHPFGLSTVLHGSFVRDTILKAAEAKAD